MPRTRYFTDYAWLGGDQVTEHVLVEVDGDRIAGLQAGVDRPADAVHLRGITVPGLANAHCHAFHRALRGRTHRARGTFWTWREDMYRVAARLTPDSYHALARALYAEMALAGISCVGEFHYVHHGPGGTPYRDRNAMGDALVAAAQDAGIRITLLDTCYLAGGIGAPLQGPQLRFGDGDAAGWASRVSELYAALHVEPDTVARAAWDPALDAAPNAVARAAWYPALDAAPPAASDAARDAAPDAVARAAWYPALDAAPPAASDAAPDAAPDAARNATPPAVPHARVGATIHSVRAVPAAALRTVADWARERNAPLHFHLSEQRAENDACLAAYGRTPTQLLEDYQALGPGSSAVHATHLTVDDIAALSGSATAICMTPTTERDLADGIGPARDLADAGSALTLGSDSNAVVDLFEEARAVELDERLRTERRGHWTAAELLRAATADGHASLGWPEAGRLASGAVADFVTLSLDSVRLSGAEPATLLESVVFAATAADVTDLVVGGRRIVAERHHALLEDVPAALDAAIRAALR